MDFLPKHLANPAPTCYNVDIPKTNTKWYNPRKRDKSKTYRSETEQNY